MLQYFPNITGSLQVTGSVSVSGSITATGGIIVSGSIASASYSSNSELLDNLDSTAFVFTSSFNTYSSSMSTRTTTLENASASLNTASGSFSGRVTTIESKYATTGSNIFTGAQTVCANITSTGTIIAQTLNVQQVTSSIVYSSGSNIFGCSLSNTQQFTGSVLMTGSLTVTTAGTSPEFQVNSGGTIKGNALTDVHQVTGSLRITGSLSTVGVACFSSTVCSNRVSTTDGSNVSTLENNFLRSTAGNFYFDACTVGGNFNFRTSNASALDSTALFICGGNSRVGIGTSSPAYLLDVSGQVRINSAYPQLTISGSDALITMYDTFQPYAYSMGVGYNKNYAFEIIDRGVSGASNNTVLIVTGSNIGIGTTSPSGKLTVEGTAGTEITSIGSPTQKLYFWPDGSGVMISTATSQGGEGIYFNNSSDLIYFQTANTERMRITSAGKVAINDNVSLDSLFTVNTKCCTQYNAAAYLGNAANIRLTNGAACIGAYSGVSFGGGGATEGFFGIVQNSTCLAEFVWQTYNGSAYGERMRMTSGGLVGIGDTNIQSGLYIAKYGSNWDGDSQYTKPTGSIFLSMGYSVSNTDNWFGIRGNYGSSTGTANILLQANYRDIGSQAGHYIASKATGLGAADFEIGKLTTSVSVGNPPTKVPQLYITSGGNLYVGKCWGDDFHRITRLTSQGGAVLIVSGYDTSNNNSIQVNGASGASANAAATVLWVATNSSTSRSINAGGTINASGADYAEYMTKAIEDNIAKGDIVGVNAQGKLTNVFDDAISFVVKSTDPSYVGGDTWGNEEIIGEKRPTKTTDETEEEFASKLSAFEAKLEEARAKVDRISFSGQIPCNVYGATVGDYIIPIKLEDGKIGGQAVSNPTLEQYKISVGKVWKIMNDGRAWIAVKIG